MKKQKDDNVVVEIPQSVMIPLRILGFFGGLLIAIIPAGIGLMLMFSIPVLGIILAIPCFIIAIGIPSPALFSGNKIRRTQYIEGGCPRCGTHYKKRLNYDKAFNCGVCKRRILVTTTGFELA